MSTIFCRHARELWDRDETGPTLRCARCHRVRPNILGNAAPRYHRTQAAGRTETMTGIERQAAEADEMITDERIWGGKPWQS